MAPWPAGRPPALRLPGGRDGSATSCGSLGLSVKPGWEGAPPFHSGRGLPHFTVGGGSPCFTRVGTGGLTAPRSAGWGGVRHPREDGVRGAGGRLVRGLGQDCGAWGGVPQTRAQGRGMQTWGGARGLEAGRGRGEGAPEELGGKQESTCVRPSPDRVTAVGEQRQEWGAHCTRTRVHRNARVHKARAGTRRRVHENTHVVHGHMLTHRHMNTRTHMHTRHTGTRSHAGTRTCVHKNAHVYTRMHACTMHTGTRRHTQTCTGEHTRGTWAHAHMQAHEHENARVHKAHRHTLTHGYMHMCT